ncbi:MAG: amino acid ABC transporter substrate-binding protein [Gammaproteobacteria bacterium]|nr:amino acid ABC transporter substrate-binding protein [Gammaproteobacteria bacterium]
MRILFHAVTVAVSLGLSACGEKSEPAKQTPPQAAAPAPAKTACTWVMGWDAWEPYQYQDAGGQMQGLDVEVAQALADKAGCKLSFKEDSWLNLLKGMQEGSIQLLAGASRTPEREQFAWFTDAYRNERFALYVLADKAAERKDKGLEDLLKAGFKLGVTEGYVFGAEVEGLRDQPAYEPLFITASVSEANYAALQDKSVDGVLDDPVAAGHYLRRRELTAKVVAQGTEFTTGDISVMLGKKSFDEAKFQEVNSALRELVQGGQLNAIFARY